jgi:hypothetical protein
MGAILPKRVGFCVHKSLDAALVESWVCFFVRLEAQTLAARNDKMVQASGRF